MYRRSAMVYPFGNAKFVDVAQQCNLTGVLDRMNFYISTAKGLRDLFFVEKTPILL